MKGLHYSMTMTRAHGERIAGYELYATDCTKDPALEAETLPDRGQSKKGRHAPVEVGHVYSWLVRLVEQRTSWCMPLDVRRVPTESTDSQVGAEQVASLAKQRGRPKVVVGDSLYCNATFLAVFLTIQFVYALGILTLKSSKDAALYLSLLEDSEVNTDADLVGRSVTSATVMLCSA